MIGGHAAKPRRTTWPPMYESITREEIERRIAACHASVRALYDYWRAKRGDRLMPSRKELDPVDLKPCLPSIILVDVVPDARRFVYRLVGTKEVSERGYDPTGMPISEAFFAKTAEETLNLYSYIVRSRAPFCFRDPYEAPDGQIEHEDIVYLPLSSNGTDVDMILVYSYNYQFRSRMTGSSFLR
jgi:hypothetical protein